MELLHPELAKIASRYDEIVNLCKVNKITIYKANDLIGKLFARDDNGIYWSIDPRNGRWFYVDMENNKIFAEPPIFGAVNYDINLISETKRRYDYKVYKKTN